jgi:hypothetical protein
MKIKVYAVGKNGVKISFNPDKWLNFGPTIASNNFTKGLEYDVDTVPGKRGDEIVKVSGGAAPAEAPKKAYVPKVGAVKSSYVPDPAKDLRISRQGCIQAAVGALGGLYPDVDKLFNEAEKLANKMLVFVNEK